MFPSQVEELLALVDGVPSEYTINIAHDEPANKDIMLVEIPDEKKERLLQLKKAGYRLFLLSSSGTEYSSDRLTL